MSEIAIRVESLGKQYRIGQLHRRPDTLRDTLMGLFMRNDKTQTQDDNGTFWALKDVSFEVKRGEVIGVIGRNGAGKSTLLKLLTRISEPTRGSAVLSGRVGSLLEVGTGFHDELTGRENVYLSGAILGMKRAEIRRRFDEIVTFSGIERFIDTPVKRYSSGMKVRLGFAVAAHLEPEVLLVDEVLAVGDMAFQERCLGKARSLSSEGRTILLVSHNMTSILDLCNRAILLEQGMLKHIGSVENIVTEYLSANAQPNEFLPEKSIEVGGDSARITHLSVNPHSPKTGDSTRFTIGVTADIEGGMSAVVSIAIKTSKGIPVLQYHSKHMGVSIPVDHHERHYSVTIDSLPLVPGDYSVNVWLGNGNSVLHWLQNCFLLRVSPGKFTSDYVDDRGYPVVLPAHWQSLVNEDLDDRLSTVVT